MSYSQGYSLRADRECRRLKTAPYARQRDSTKPVAEHKELFVGCMRILNLCYRAGLCKNANVGSACTALRFEIERLFGTSILRVECSYNIKQCCNRNLDCSFRHKTPLTSPEMCMFQSLPKLIIDMKTHAEQKNFMNLAKKLKVLEVALYPFTEVESASTKITTTCAIGRTDVPLRMTDAEITQFLETLLLTVKQSQLPE